MPRGIWIAVAVVVALGVVFAWHYFLYHSTLQFFGLGRGSRKVLGTVLVLLPASFFASSFVMRRTGATFARSFSILSSLWLGVGLALLLFYLLAWAAWGVAGFHNPRPNSVWFGLAAVLLAGLYSTYGIWNAEHPIVRTLTVKIRNLPPSWRGRRLVQITDLHLGLAQGPAFLEDVVRKVNAQDPAAVAITGDLFETDGWGLDRFVGPLNQIRAPLGVYFVTGNHETYLGVERAETVLKKTNVRVLDDEMLVIDGLQLLGLSYPRNSFSRDMAAAIQGIRGFDRARPSILLYHSPSQVPAVKAAGIGFEVTGHTHHGQLLPFQLITRLVYGKYDHGLNVEGDFAIYTSPGTGTWGPMMRTGDRAEITVFRLEPM